MSEDLGDYGGLIIDVTTGYERGRRRNSDTKSSIGFLRNFESNGLITKTLFVVLKHTEIYEIWNKIRIFYRGVRHFLFIIMSHN